MVSMDCTSDEGKPIFMLVALHYGWMFAAFYCMAIMLMTFGLFNVIVAIYVENTMVSARYSDAKQKRCRLLDQTMFEEKVEELVEFVWRVHAGKSEGPAVDIDKLCDMEMTADFFNELREHIEFQDLLQALDVSDEDQIDLFDTLDVDGSGTLDITEMITGISKLRGDARRSDIIGIKLMARAIQAELKDLSMALANMQEDVNDAKRRRKRPGFCSRSVSPFSRQMSMSSRLPRRGTSTSDTDEWSPMVWQLHSSNSSDRVL